MPRRTFDMILTAVGGVVTVVLLVAGALLMWGYSFANSNVHDQLSQQNIYFPAKGSSALQPSNEIGKYLDKYAGQKLTDGAQAEAYADHFIAVHLKEIGGGQTYAQVSSKSQANPNDTKLAAEVQTLFRGETLRGMLLNAYAFWQLGQIALFAAIAAFVLAVVMLVLTALGMVHLRGARPDDQIFAGQRAPAPATE